MAKAPCAAAAQKSLSRGTRKPPPDPYERLPDKNRWNSILDLLGDLDPETADPYDLEMAEDYLLECLYQTDDPETFNTGLVDLAEEAIWFNGHRRPQPKGPMFTIGPWIVTQDGDPDAAAIYNRHYSAKPNRTRWRYVSFSPPKKRMVSTMSGPVEMVIAAMEASSRVRPQK